MHATTPTDDSRGVMTVLRCRVRGCPYDGRAWHDHEWEMVALELEAGYG